ncbi:GAF domain-containing protein [Streptomyces hokutonensis]|uniref:GAF domain-containing protein n=1 Tax=Streptomyces hokutonensis TaxID=1306990 RepID=A0ABW6MDF6_9ACTN
MTDRCVGMLGVSAAGVLLTDRNGELRVMAASSEQVRVLELFQLQNDEGPCVPDVTTEIHRWPRFAAQAHHSGFAAVQALPMRLRDEVVGALNLFRSDAGPFDPVGTLIAQALADVATISLSDLARTFIDGTEPLNCLVV